MILLSISAAYMIYVTAMFFSQNELEREIKARLPFDYEHSQIDEMKKIHKEVLRKEGKLSFL